MSGLTGAIDIAASGTQAFEQGIATVSQNIANQTTAGYAAEQVVTTPIVSGGSPAGDGVQSSVSRAADGFVAGLLRTATSANAAAGVLQTSTGTLSSAVANNGNVESAINQFMLDVGSLASAPTSAAQRQTVLSDAQVATGAFHSAAGAIASVQQSSMTSLGNDVTQANSLLTQLAAINTHLTQSPNDPTLLDQQQAALQSLSSLVQFNTIPIGGSGQVMVAAGGSVLLNQAGAQALSVAAGANGAAPTVTVGASANPLALTPTDGTIGAHAASWAQSDAAQQSLNALAARFAGQINLAQAQGVTSTGAAGAALFTVPAPAATANAANTGTATLAASVSDPAALDTAGSRYSVTFSGTAGWSATNQATGTSYSLGTGTSLKLPGLTLAVSGTPAANDSFTVDASPAAAGSIAVATAQPSAIAAADPYVVTPGQIQSDGSVINSNGGTVTGGSPSVTTSPATGAVTLPQSAVGQTLQIVFTSATNFNVTTATTPSTTVASGSLSGTNGSATIAIPYASSSAASGSYWQVPISGTAVAGDVLTLSQSGSGNGNNAQRMQTLWTNATSSSGSGSMQQAFLSLTTGLGSQAQQATTTQTQTAAQVTTATTNLQSVAGVDLNQQAVLLTEYQQAFQASAQVITSARAMFQSLLQAV
ncbi:FlgK family flagellar hook-associated protein [Acidisoma sp. C75]